MALLTRGENVVVLRYGIPPGGDRDELHEIAMRVDVSLQANIASLAEAAPILSRLGALGRYVRTHWEGQLLVADDEPRALAFADAHPRLLPRGRVHLFPTVSACSVAMRIVRDWPLQSVQVSLGAGPSYIASPLGATGAAGTYAPSQETYTTWTRASSKTKFKLVRRTDRAGEDS